MYLQALGSTAGSFVRRVGLIAAVVVAGFAFVGVAPAGATTFSNTAAISPADGTICGSNCDVPGVPSVYPSNIAVSGVSGPISALTVTLNAVSHPYVPDLDVLLVGPGGQKFVLVSDSGDFLHATTNATVTFDDNAASTVPTTGGWTTTSYRPTDVQDLVTDAWPSPAPAGPYSVPAPHGSATLMSTFGGISANGTWSLYVVDDSAGGTGSIAGGWSLDVSGTTAAATATTVSSSKNPSLTGDNVTFTAHVTRQSDSSDVTTGDVTFKEGSTTLASGKTLDSNGDASFSTSSLPEGNHVITAFYNGDASNALSNGSVTQVVDNATTVTGSSYCNTGTLVANDKQGSANAQATPYPSHVFVSSLGGAISKLTMTAKNVSEPFASDLDVLLVGPAGQSLMVVSDAGGNDSSGALSHVTTTFDDDAASAIGLSGGWLSSSRPVDYNDGVGSDAFPLPAPTLFGESAPTGGSTFASVFGGDSPNGTWSLYVIDDSASSGNGGTFADGWCLNFTTTNDPATTTSVSSSENPSATGDDVTFTAHVTDTTSGNDVTGGSVTFKDGSTVIGTDTLDASGHASVHTSTLTEGSHTITANYGGNPGVANVSNASLTQEVDSPTVASNGSYCNNGGIALANGTSTPIKAQPYPSHVTISGVSGNLDGLTVKLKGVTYTRPENIDALLVGPHGQSLELVSDAGDVTASAAITNVDVTLDDSASTSLPGSGAWTSGTYKPTDYAVATEPPDAFPAPAPAGSFGDPAPAGTDTLNGTFGGTDPNGTWSLYIVADSLGGSGSLGGWCVTPATTPAIHVPNDITTTESSYGAGAAVNFTVTADGTPTPTITCKEGSAVVHSGDTFAVGTHTIDCTATNTAGSDSGSFTITVDPANRAPTADAGGPYSVTEGHSVTLDGSASNDPDGDTLTYSWDVNGDGTFGDATGVGPTLTWSQLSSLGMGDGPATFHPTVRVSDGKANAVTSSGATLAVVNAAPTAGITAPSTTLPGQAITASLSATDPSAVDQAAGFDYTVDWGDGSSDGPFHGGSPVNRGHTYGSVGTYQVSVTATDKDNGTSVAAQTTITVGGVQLVPATCGSGSDLVIGGTSGADTIAVTAGTASGSVAVKINGVAQGQFKPTGRIIVYGQAGNDSITFASQLSQPRIVYGGAGADTVTGGNGNGVQIGGDGNDSLSAGNGRDIVFGGDGADTIAGGNGDDLVASGPTAYDVPTTAALTKLCAIQAEWTRTDAPYATRVAHLNGTTSGGLNGTALLTTSGSGRTVFDDAFRDSVTGGQGSDWFLLNAAGGTVLDHSDATRSEVVTDL